MAKPAIYGRVSSQRQESEQTIQSQLAELREAVDRSGESGCLEFTDEGYSRDDLARPGLDRLRDLVQSGDVDHVYVQSPDRLASGAKLVILYEEITEAGATVTFLKGDVTDTPEGRLLLHMEGAIGEYEKAKISERTRRGKLYWAREGYLPVRIQPYGYTYVHRDESGRGRLKIDEETAPIVASMYRWFTDERLTLRGIAGRLQQQRVPTAGRAVHWYASVVRQMLSNPAYRGEVMFQRTERIKGSTGQKTRTRKRKESDWISIPVPQIVSEETWNEAQGRLKQNREFASRNAKREYMLRGLLFCAECGYRLVGQARRTRRVYRCNNVDRIVGSHECKGFSVDADRVERPVWDALVGALKDPKVLQEQYLAQMDRLQVTDDYDLVKKQLQFALRNILRQEDRITDAYRNEAMELDRYKSEMTSLRERRESAATQLTELEKLQLRSESQKSAIDRIAGFCQQVSVGIDSLSGPDKQELLRLLVDRITIEGGQVKVETIIPSNAGDVGILCTRDPELNSESLSNPLVSGEIPPLRSG